MDRRRLASSGPAALALVVAVCLVSAPIFGAFLHEDDFALLAQARLLDNPFAAFASPHMLTMPYYRPLGTLVWWLSVRAFGIALVPQYTLALALHAAVALTLVGLLRDLSVRRLVAWSLGFLFALQPAALGTVAWLADRYDLLATLFGLLALRGALRFARTPSTLRLAWVLAALALALLAKETGVVLALVTAWFVLRETVTRTWRWCGLGAIVVVVVAWLAARREVLGFFGGGRADFTTLLAEVGHGCASWWAGLVPHVTYVAWLPGWAVGVLVLGVVAGGAWLLRNGRGKGRRQRTLLIAGMALVALAGLVQAPFLGLQPVRVPLPADVPAAVTQSRYYYLALVGLVLLVAALIDTDRVARRGLGFVVMLGLMVPAALAAHALAAAWRDNTRVFAPQVAAATRAIGALGTQARGCQIYLLDTRRPLLDTQADVVIKARIDDLATIAPCLIQSESSPWFNLVPAGSLAGLMSEPLVPLRRDGRQVPWPRLGNVEMAFFNLRPGAAPRTTPATHYFAWDGDAFVNADGAVRDGRRRIVFRCGREPAQCPAPIPADHAPGAIDE